MSSRVIVKNLPRYLKEERLKKHFGERGNVTDAKIMMTKDGKSSRRFGFVGFKTAGDAKQAVAYFDRSYIDTCRISVEVAKAFGDPELPRAWSRYSKGSSAFNRQADWEAEQKAQKKAAKKEKKRKARADAAAAADADDASRIADSGVVKRRRTGDDAGGGGGGEAAMDDAKKKKLDEFLSLYDKNPSENGGGGGGVGGGGGAAVPRHRGKVVQKKEHLVFGDDSDSDADAVYEDIAAKDNAANAAAFQQRDDVPGGGGKRDGDGDSDDDSSDDSDADAFDSDGNERQSNGMTREQERKAVEAISESGRLFVRNLPYTATEGDLEHKFKKYGALSEVHVPIDRTSKKPTGIAFVSYLTPADALAAYTSLDGKPFQGRLLHILPVDESKNTKRAPGGVPGEERRVAGSLFKAQQEEEQRKNAGDANVWNTLFMRTDTVTNSMADRYGVSKMDILDVHGDSGGGGKQQTSMAVRVALGETQIVAETKAYLAAEGVMLEGLQRLASEHVKRSKTLIIAKNLPYSTTERALENLFGQFGDVARIILPPSRAIALVEFYEPSEARAAFKRLAYKKFEHVPLKLEMAPVGVVAPAVRGAKKPAAAAGQNIHDVHQGVHASRRPYEPPAQQRQLAQAEPEPELEPDLEAGAEAEAAPRDADGGAPTSTLHVSNLNFSTSDESLRKLFEPLGGVQSARVLRKKNVNGKLLSQGFGFVEFAKRADAVNALKQLEGALLDGHAVRLSLARDRTEESQHMKTKAKRTITARGKRSTKLMVKNMPFEATKHELRELFGTYGQIKTLRVPKKFDGTNRGFSFIEFLTKQEAENAMRALEHTHLYGRHLVIEYAHNEKRNVKKMLDADTARTADAADE